MDQANTCVFPFFVDNQLSAFKCSPAALLKAKKPHPSVPVKNIELKLVKEKTQKFSLGKFKRSF